MTPLTADRVRFIRAKLAEGWTQKRIADKMGFHKSYVSYLKRQHIDRMDLPLYDRWLNVHKIGDIGKRAVEETS